MPLVVGNWKMHTTLDEAVRLASDVARGADTDAVAVAVCPPFVWLEAVAERLRGSGVALGAQNVHPEAEGAFTGEVSPVMLRALGCRYVIVGHSERRQMGEADALIGRKVRAALAHGLAPILCVGETVEERDAGSAEAVVTGQLAGALEGLEAPGALVVAYEPVWAIGTGRTATPEQAQAMHVFVRARLGERFGDAGRAVPLLYGGSVKPDSAPALFAQPDLDGGLIGGASLDAGAFSAIVAAAADASRPRRRPAAQAPGRAGA
ncbi:MAG: triose-phosphate isomerase [Rubricoccaceae bacterium]